LPFARTDGKCCAATVKKLMEAGYEENARYKPPY